MNILILNGSPKKDGNTKLLVDWFREGAEAAGAVVEIVRTASLKIKTPGCLSCRACQKLVEYRCAVEDEASPVLRRMAEVDVIVLATPLYFFGSSAQIKMVTDRMFSLYKWDNAANTMTTPLRGKTLVLLASAYEGVGLEALREPFRLTADYTGMPFESLVVPNAGVSGDIRKLESTIRPCAVALGAKVAGRVGAGPGPVNGSSASSDRVRSAKS